MTREELAQAIAIELPLHGKLTHLHRQDAYNFLAALDRLGLRVVGPEEQAVLDAAEAWYDAPIGEPGRAAPLAAAILNRRRGAEGDEQQ